MTTLTIEIPPKFEKAFAELIEQLGGKIVSTRKKSNRASDEDDEKLTPAELELLRRGLKEALLIKGGKIKSSPFSELWNN